MSNENSKMEYESGVTPFPMQALTDSGDQKKFSSGAALFSESAGNTSDIRPNGVLTGGIIIPAVSATNNLVDIAALTCNLNGVNTSVSASIDEAITRPASSMENVSSITVNAAGAIAVITGTDAATIVETRGAAGGPPYIPTDSIEIGQVRLTDDVAALILQIELFQVVGTHFEKSDFPIFTGDNFNGEVNFDIALPMSHTGDVTKAVFASYSDVIFTEQTFANDFVPAETTNAVSSEQVYSATVGTATSSLSQGSFTAILKDGITDNIISRKNENLFFRYTQDRFKTPHVLTQGKLGLARTFVADDNAKVTCTISATLESVERAA